MIIRSRIMTLSGILLGLLFLGTGCLNSSQKAGGITGYVSITTSQVPGAALALRAPVEGEVPLPMARVSLDGGSRLAIADEFGRFLMTGLSPGVHTLEVSHPKAWNTVNRRIQVLPEQTVTALEPPTGRGFYLFVGISNYQNPRYNLRGPERDVDTLVTALGSGADGKISNLMTLKSSQATKSGIQNAISMIAGEMEPSDYLVLFYSGHGEGSLDPNSPILKKDCIVPYDFNVMNPSSVITDGELGDWLDAVPSGKVTVILDSCYSGSFADGVETRSLTSGEVRLPYSPTFGAGIDGGIMYKALRTRPGMVLLAASRNDQESIEVDGNGLFTEALAAGLSADRVTADKNKDRIINTRELFDYTTYWMKTKQSYSSQIPYMWPDPNLLEYRNFEGQPIIKY